CPFWLFDLPPPRLTRDCLLRGIFTDCAEQYFWQDYPSGFGKGAWPWFIQPATLMNYSSGMRANMLSFLVRYQQVLLLARYF
ncbi:hypothetical protein, partial [Sphingobium yanoikuyae]|uniref:hypothetical protein n=1 Tax=Sphingobium yanoikuyae TaxID=13690 RepID=UPI00244C0E05